MTSPAIAALPPVPAAAADAAPAPLAGLFAQCLQAQAPTAASRAAAPPHSAALATDAPANGVDDATTANDSLLALLNRLDPALPRVPEAIAPLESPSVAVAALPMPALPLAPAPNPDIPAASPRQNAATASPVAAVATEGPAPVPSADASLPPAPAVPATTEPFNFPAVAAPAETPTLAPSAASAALPAAAIAPRTQAVESLPMLTATDTSAANFAEHFSEQVIWQVNQGLHEARIQLHPQDLGAVDIQLSLEGEQATLVFTVEQPQARAAVQSALPQLGAMLAGQGLQLADAQVQSQQRGFTAPQNPGRAQSDSNTREEPAPVTVRRRVGLIDHYA